MSSIQDTEFIRCLEELEIEILYEQHGEFSCRITIKNYLKLLDENKIKLNEICQRLEPMWTKKHIQVCLHTIIEPLINKDVAFQSIGTIVLGIYKGNLCVLDGGNRTRTIKGFVSGEFIECKNGKKTEPFCELKIKGEKVLRNIAFKESSSNPEQNKAIDMVLSEEQKTQFLNYYIDIKIQCKPYSMNSLNKRFNSIQNQVPIGKRDSDYLKNETHIPFVKFSSEQGIFISIQKMNKKCIKISKYYVDITLLLFLLFENYTDNVYTSDEIIEKYVSKDDKEMGEKILRYREDTTEIPSDELSFYKFKEIVNETLIPTMDNMETNSKMSMIGYKSLTNIILKSVLRDNINPDKVKRILINNKNNILNYFKINTNGIWYGKCDEERKRYSHDVIKNCFIDTSYFLDNIFQENMSTTFIANFASPISVKPQNIKTKRKAIPTTIRNKLKKRDFKDKEKIICPCCNIKYLYLSTRKGFDAGHIISDKDGGETKLENLIAICSFCNVEMDTMNLYEYQEKTYPSVYPIREYMKELYPDI